MLMKSALMALVGLAAIAEASVVPFMPPSGQLMARQNRGGNGGNRNGGNQGGNQNQGGNNNNNNNNGGNNNNNGGNNNNNNGGNNGGNCLNPNVIQSASASTGQNGQVEQGQVESATDANNFINFCQGKTITNGEQNRGGSCNGIVMGEIPAANRMVSTVILNPKNGDNLQQGQTFNIQVRIANMQLGAFTNAQATYYSAPQKVQNGQIVGHTHVTVQDLGGNLNPTNPLNAEQFVFFKGINDNGNGQGTLQTEVSGGLPNGNYRLCTMAGASNHQPVLMPVAQRGAQDDCIRFTVGGNNNNNNGGNNNNGNNNNNGGNNNNNGGNNNNNGGNNNNNGGNNNNNGGNQGGNQNQGGNGGNNNNNNNNNNNGGNQGGNGGNQNQGRQNSQAIGGAAPAVENSGDQARPFRVNGNTFVNRAAAVERACAIQNNACNDAVNRGQAQGSTLQDCTAQEAACVARG